MAAAKKGRSRLSAHRTGQNAQGRSVDPSENVKDLAEAASQRQDDLRAANNKYLEARLSAVEQEVRIRADHERELGRLTDERLDRIRQIDVSNAALAAGQQVAAIERLSATTVENAEGLRAAVASTARTIQTQTDRVVSGIVDRIAILEKASYTGAGKEAVSDPRMDRLAEVVEALARSRAEGSGKSQGVSLTAAWIVTGVTLLLGILGTVVTVIAFILRSKESG